MTEKKYPQSVTVPMSFILDVAEMMKIQKRYFQFHYPSDLVKSKEHERLVRKWLMEIYNLLDLAEDGSTQERLL